MAVLFLVIFAILVPKSSQNIKPLIVGGTNVTDIGHFPHAVYILFKCPGDTGSWLCGGSVLTQHVILTAAHCINIHCNMKMEAVAGSEAVYKDKSIIRTVYKYYRHKYFDERGPSMRNDIALLGLKVPLPLGRNIKRVVVDQHFPENVKMTTVAGWGRISDDTTELPKTLKFVWQIIQSAAHCQKQLSESLWPGQMCAESGPKAYPTTFDSGSAMMTKTGQQLGLVSSKIPQKPEIVIYTNVSHYYPWLQKHARLLYCEVSKLRIDINTDDYYGEDPNVVEMNNNYMNTMHQ